MALTVLLSSLNTSIVNVALPFLADAFAAPLAVVQWTVLAFVLAITAAVVSAGRLADALGRKRVLLAGVALFTVTAVACAAAPSLGALVTARFVQGLGAAVMMAVSLALASAIVARERAGRVMGLLGTMSAVGTALGPTLGGLILSGFGWRGIFLVNVPLGLAAIVLLRRHVPADASPSAPSVRELDLRGGLILALTLAAYALGMTSSHGEFGVRNAALLLSAAAGFAGFVALQRRTAAPLVSLDLFRSAALRVGFGLSLLVATVMMGTLVVAPFYLVRVLGAPPWKTGLAMSVGPFVAALAAIPAGRLVDRFGAGVITRVGLTAAGAGCLALALIPESCGLVGYVLPLAGMTAGYAFFQTANNTAVMQAADAANRGAISGLLNLSRNLGLVTGVAVLGALFTAACGRAGLAGASPAAIASATRVTFGTALVPIAIALALALRRNSARLTVCY